MTDIFGSVPRNRWLITKLDLLNAQAMGYLLRRSSALVPLTLASNALPAGALTVGYSHMLNVSGGIPGYLFEVTSGALPPGLTLDSFSGIISGTPVAAGDFPFTVGGVLVASATELMRVSV